MTASEDNERPRSLYPVFLGIAACVVALDQLTKHLMLARRPNASTIHVIDDILLFRLTYNSGGAFGIGQDVPGFFLAASLITLVVVLVLARRIQERSWALPLGLVLGGGIGNLVDRIVRDTGGRVVDFIDLRVWPVFNLADAAIVIGVATMFLLSFRSRAD